MRLTPSNCAVVVVATAWLAAFVLVLVTGDPTGLLVVSPVAGATIVYRIVKGAPVGHPPPKRPATDAELRAQLAGRNSRFSWRRRRAIAARDELVRRMEADLAGVKPVAWLVPPPKPGA